MADQLEQGEGRSIGSKISSVLIKLSSVYLMPVCFTQERSREGCNVEDDADCVKNKKSRDKLAEKRFESKLSPDDNVKRDYIS